MPELLCSICRQHYKVKLKDYKLLSDLTNNLCSPECLLTYMSYCKPSGINLSNLSNLVDYGVGTWWSSDLKIAFRSQFEELVALYLTTNGLNFFYEKYTFLINNIPYTPDLYIPKYDCFLEVKGVWTLGKKKKMQKVINQYPTLNLIVIPWILRGKFYEAATTRRAK